MDLLKWCVRAPFDLVYPWTTIWDDPFHLCNMDFRKQQAKIPTMKLSGSRFSMEKTHSKFNPSCPTSPHLTWSFIKCWGHLLCSNQNAMTWCVHVAFGSTGLWVGQWSGELIMSMKKQFWIEFPPFPPRKIGLIWKRFLSISQLKKHTFIKVSPSPPTLSNL